jgi:MFS family permease
MTANANAFKGPGGQRTSDATGRRSARGTDENLVVVSSTVETPGGQKDISRRQAMRAVLAVPNFRRYVSGQALSLIGTWVETVAQGLLVLRLTHSGVLLGLTTAARYAPILLLSPYAGLVVDRFDKRRILLVTQFGLGCVSLLLGLAVLSGEVTLWQVFMLGTVFGAFSAIDNPARQAFVSEVVDRSLIRGAVTFDSTAVNVARVIGPTVAALVIDSAGIGWCFVINAVSFLFVIGSLLLLDGTKLHPTIPVGRSRRQVRQGLSYAAGVPEIFRPLLMMAFIGTFTFEFEVSLPLLSRETFHGGAGTYSWLLGAFGAGAVFGGLYSGGRSRTGVMRLTRTAMGFGLAMGLLAIMPDLWPAVGASVLVGLATITFLITGNSTVQLAAKPQYRGRVMALWSIALVGSTAVGAPLVGLVSGLTSPRYGLALGALACVTAAVIGWWPEGNLGDSRRPHHQTFMMPARSSVFRTPQGLTPASALLAASEASSPDRRTVQ